MDSWMSTGGTACNASRPSYDLTTYGFGSTNGFSSSSTSNDTCYSSRTSSTLSTPSGSSPTYRPRENGLSSGYCSAGRDSPSLLSYDFDHSYTPARRSYKSYTLDDLLGTSSTYANGSSSKTNGNGCSSYELSNGTGNSIYSDSTSNRHNSYNGSKGSHLRNGYIKDNLGSFETSYKDSYSSLSSNGKVNSSDDSSLTEGRSSTRSNGHVNEEEANGDEGNGDPSGDDGVYDQNGKIVTSYTPQPTTNGCTYIPRTMFGDEKYYYRKMKEVLEARPNKGPPYAPTKLSNFLYIGNIKNAEDFSLLKRLGITHVLNLAGTRNFDVTKSPYPKVTGVKSYLQIAAVDSDTYDMSQHFKESFKFLDKCKREGGTALVHCNLGINRSGCIAIAWMMLDTRQTILEICTFVKLKRSVVLCNRSFRRQVIRLAREKGFLDKVPPEDIATCRTEEKKSNLFRSFSRSSLSFGHRRSKSEPGAAKRTASTSDLSQTSDGSIRYIPNGLLTPSMRRPLRLTASATTLCNPSSSRPAFAEDEEEEEYRIDSRELDTLYEEIEQMQMTSPFSQSTTVAIRTPDEQAHPRVAELRNSRPRRLPDSQNNNFLTVPSATSRRTPSTRLSQRPQSMYSSTPALPSMYSSQSSSRSGSSRSTRPSSTPTTPSATDDNPHSYKAFFGSLFQRKKHSDKDKNWRKSMHL